MKILYIFLLLFVISNVYGQRRTTPKTDTTDVEKPHPPSRGRGRSRFTATPEYAEISEPTKAPSESTSRRLTSRKRVSETTERRSTRPTEKTVKPSTYEVDEVINESPIDPFKRQSKPRVLTESHFESIHAPKKKLIDPIQAINAEPTPILEELFRTVDSSIANTAAPEISSSQPETTNDIGGSAEVTDATFKTNLLDVSSEISKSNEITREFTKSQAITTPKPTESRRAQNGVRRNNIRSRTSIADVSEEASQAPRSRSRVRPTRRPEETVTQANQGAPSRVVNRPSRRRPETSTPLAETSKKGPTLFVAEETQTIPRSKPGKRSGPPSASEKISIDFPNGRIKDASRKRTATPATTTTTRSEEDSKKRTSSRFQSRNLSSTTPSSRSRSRSKDVIPTVNEFTPPTTSAKGRFRARDFPPIIDEQKLEVLPLFEIEPKTVRPVSKSRSRSRTRSINHSHETIQTSATENDLKFTPKAKEVPRFSVSRTQTVNVETRTETSVKRKVATRAPIVKESVIAEVSEVTSKRTVTRRKNLGLKNLISAKIKTEKPKVTVSQVVTSSRGKKKSGVNLGEVKKSGENSEEVDESDNYPEPFKALIQAKKSKKESRPSSRSQTSVPTITSIVTTAPSTTSVSSTTADKEDDILDNELDPKPSSTTTATTSTTTVKPSTKPSRKRFSLTTKYPEQISATVTTKRPTFPSRKSSKVVRSTAQPTTTATSSKEHRFHAKFSSTLAPVVRSESSVQVGRGTVSPRGLYSSRKNKEDKGEVKEKYRKGSVESAVQSTQSPKAFSPQKKSSRYSSKYRTDISARGSASRSTTSAPVYIPTIPTAAYVPTIPTIRPSRTTTENVWSEDAIDYNWPFSRLY